MTEYPEKLQGRCPFHVFEIAEFHFQQWIFIINAICSFRKMDIQNEFFGY
jgi:hypothetical protein